MRSDYVYGTGQGTLHPLRFANNGLEVNCILKRSSVSQEMQINHLH